MKSLLGHSAQMKLERCEVEVAAILHSSNCNCTVTEREMIGYKVGGREEGSNSKDVLDIDKQYLINC